MLDIINKWSNLDMPRQKKFCFARVHLSVANMEKIEIIDKAFSHNEQTLTRKNIVAFSSLEKSQKYISGYLAVYEKEGYAECVSQDNAKIESHKLEKHILFKSFFVFDPSTMIISFQVVNGITELFFMHRAQELFENAIGTFFSEAIVSPILKREDLLEKFKKLSFVKSIRITLVPSNPHSGKPWASIDEKFKKLDIEKYIVNTTFKNKGSKSAKNDIDTLTQLNMVSDGYGTADIRGENNNIEERITSQKKPRSLYTDLQERAELSDYIIDNIRMIQKNIISGETND